MRTSRRGCEPPRRTHRRDVRSRGTCRSSRSRATAERCRRACAARAAACTASCIDAARFERCTRPSSAAASAGASLPISTACRTLPRKACGQRREVLALAHAARDHHQGSRHAGDRGDGRADVRALGVVDVAHAAGVGDPLRAMRQVLERTRALRASWARAIPRHRPARAPRAHWPRCAGPRSSVRPVSSSAIALAGEQRARSGPEQREIRVGALDGERDGAACRRGASQPPAGRPHSAPRWRPARKSATWPARRPRWTDSDPCDPPSRSEPPPLEAAARTWSRAENSTARERTRSGVGCSSRSSAATPRLPPASTVRPPPRAMRATKRRDRALAVGAGDADHRRAHVAGKEFDVAEHFDAAIPRRPRDRLLERQPRGHQHLRGSVEQRQIEAAEPQVELIREIAEIGESRRRAARIGGAHRDAALRQVAQAGNPGFAEADDDAMHQRIFKVARPNNMSTKLMIQKRTITFGSAHPLSSKW